MKPLDERARARRGAENRAPPRAATEVGHTKCGVLGVAPNAPEPDENPSGMRGKRMRR